MPLHDLQHKANPIGVMPKWLSDDHRAIDVLQAMLRYVEGGYVFPIEWADEIAEYARKKSMKP